MSGPLIKTPDVAFAVALAELQGKIPKIPKSESAQVPTKTGSYTVRYADLSSLTDKLLPLLSVHGFSWSCRPTLLESGAFVLEYELLHASGESRVGRYPLPAGGTPQAIGSAITYGRRYCMAAVVGAAPEDDDDAAAAEAEAQARRGTAQRGERATARVANTERAQARSAPASRPSLPGEPDPILPSQRNRMMGLFGKLGVVGKQSDGRDARLWLTGQLLGREIETSNSITKFEASELIDTLAQAETQEDPRAFLEGRFKAPSEPVEPAQASPPQTSDPEAEQGQQGPDGIEP